MNQTQSHTQSGMQGPVELQANALKAMYERVAQQHDRIDDFRAKLLGFLPVVTGIGLFALVEKVPSHTEYLTAIGIFGALASIGLFEHELVGIIDCYMLIKFGHKLEDKIANSGDAKFGPFSARATLKERRYVRRETAACIVYPATITAWAVLAAFPIRQVWPVLDEWLLLLLRKITGNLSWR